MSGEAVETRSSTKTTFIADGNVVGEVFQQGDRWVGRWFVCGFAGCAWCADTQPDEESALVMVRRWMSVWCWRSA